MSVLKSHITARHTPPSKVAAAVEVRHITGTDAGDTSALGGLYSDGGSTSISKDLYREVRRYLGLI